VNARDFDALVERLRSGSSRRDAMRGVVGGALVSVGAAAVVEGKSKNKGGKRAGIEHNAVGNGKRVFCFCPNANPQVCETRRVKTKKFKKLFRNNPASHRGPCETTPTTGSPTTSQPTTTTNQPPPP
jgi:hypothetical protein